MRVGILTGGGDAPGLNSVIETCVRHLQKSHIDVLGILDGFEGLFQGNILPLNSGNILGIHSLAGTYLGASNQSSLSGREAEFLQKYRSLNLDGLLVCGGDGTFAALKGLAQEIPIIGLPKTIDNDIAGSEVSFGYDTACEVIVQSAEALRATADAHRRIFFIETMGRTSGWLALRSGLATYADIILLPERPFNREALKAFVLAKKVEGRRSLMCVVAEGAFAQGESETVAFEVAQSPKSERLGGISAELARWLEKETGWSSRNMVLGHLQRARSPSVTDQILTRELGLEAAQLAIGGVWNRAVLVKDGRVTHDELSVFMQGTRTVPEAHPWIQRCRDLDIFI